MRTTPRRTLNTWDTPDVDYKERFYQWLDDNEGWINRSRYRKHLVLNWISALEQEGTCDTRDFPKTLEPLLREAWPNYTVLYTWDRWVTLVHANYKSLCFYEPTLLESMTKALCYGRRV